MADIKTTSPHVILPPEVLPGKELVEQFAKQICSLYWTFGAEYDSEDDFIMYTAYVSGVGTVKSMSPAGCVLKLMHYKLEKTAEEFPF